MFVPGTLANDQFLTMVLKSFIFFGHIPILSCFNHFGKGEKRDPARKNVIFFINGQTLLASASVASNILIYRLGR